MDSIQEKESMDLNNSDKGSTENQKTDQDVFKTLDILTTKVRIFVTTFF